MITRTHYIYAAVMQDIATNLSRYIFTTFVKTFYLICSMFCNFKINKCANILITLVNRSVWNRLVEELCV